VSAFAALREKYVEMLRMRRADATEPTTAGAPEPPEVTARRREEMARLAERFPGALREIRSTA
jgi:hypothetical protein